MNSMVKPVKQKIAQILQELVKGIDLESKALVDDGYITSITMIQLICELDVAFDIEITFNAISKANFNSVDAIERMVVGFQQLA